MIYDGERERVDKQVDVWVEVAIVLYIHLYRFSYFSKLRAYTSIQLAGDHISYSSSKHKQIDVHQVPHYY